MSNEMVFKGDDDKNYYIKHPCKGNRGSGSGSGSETVIWDDGVYDLIKHILIGYDEQFVYSIQTTYQRKGETVISNLHGARQGNLAMISLSEPLTWISGHYGSDYMDYASTRTSIIYSLTFGTDSTTYGPYGRPRGTPFSFRTTTGISGFHGYVCNYLSAIGVYVNIPIESTSSTIAPPKKSVKLEK